MTADQLTPSRGLVALQARTARLRSARIGGSGWAWATAAVVVAFIAISWWWVSQDRGVPFADAASHLFTAVAYRDLLAEGHLERFWTRSGIYPPLIFFVGGLGALVGGVGAGAPVVSENIVFVSALALGCYGTGRLVAGPQAGFLAVVFALGSPLLIEQFHVVMLDAPQAAMVALAVWLILRSERFSRPGPSALAGLAVGLGLNSKEQFPVFVAGVLLVVLARGGWRNVRGLALFALVAFVVAVPWYAVNLHELSTIMAAGSGDISILPPRGRPALLSISNAGWYFWATLNALLFAPLFAFAAIGLAAAVVPVLRSRRVPLARGDVRPELLGGLFVGWLGITFTPHHDMRYTMSLIVFLAVLGTAWIPRLARARRTIAVAALGLAVVASTVGLTFGVGKPVSIPLAGNLIRTSSGWGIPPPDQITLYADRDFVISAPREGDVLALFKALKREGFTGVGWLQDQAPVGNPVFDLQGLELFARFAGLTAPPLDLERPWDTTDPGHVLVMHSIKAGLSRPCATLDDGTGVWVLIDHGRRLRCPRR